MFCPKCGSSIDGGASFCPQCGCNIGMMKYSEPLQNEKKNWKDYVTRQNIEYLIAASGVFPFAFIILTGVFGIFSGIPLIGTILKVIRTVVTVLVILVELGACAGFGLVVARDKSLLSPPGYTAVGVSVLSLISIILKVCVKNAGGAAFIIALITLIVGLDVISRVFLQKMDLISEINIDRDYGACVDFIRPLIEQVKQQQAEKKQQTVNSSQPYDYSAQNTQPYSNMPMNQPTSDFDGKGVEMLGYMILSVILSSITFSIATPWTTCMILKWRKSHTIINGRRLTFTGTGGQLLGLWIKWVLLSIITLGIYAFFAYVDYLKWDAKHTFFDDERPAKGAVNPNSSFDGNTFEFIGYSILSSLLTCVTLGIGFPWACAMIMKWQMSHTVISGSHMSFNGNGVGLLGTYIICAILIIITAGIYTPWAVVKINKWSYGNTNAITPMNPVSYPNFTNPSAM